MKSTIDEMSEDKSATGARHDNATIYGWIDLVDDMKSKIEVYDWIDLVDGEGRKKSNAMVVLYVTSDDIVSCTVSPSYMTPFRIPLSDFESRNLFVHRIRHSSLDEIQMLEKLPFNSLRRTRYMLRQSGHNRGAACIPR